MIRKIIVYLAMILCLLHSVALPLGVRADDAQVTDTTTTETQTPTPGPDQNSDVNVTPTGEPSNTPTETLTPTPGDSGGNTVNVDNSAEVNNNSNSNSDSGNNSINASTPTPTPTATPSAVQNFSPDTNQNNSSTNIQPNNNSCAPSGIANVSTGDAVTLTQLENNVDTTSVNSTYSNQSLTLVGMSSEDINYQAPNPILSPDPTSTDSAPGNAVIDNNAELTNNIDSGATSGINSIDGNGNITTGDAFSIVSLVNNVNLTLINSTLQIITLNIFGTLNGDIILPDPLQISCSGCGQNLTQDITNYATVNNDIDSNAISGENTINGAKTASITTGDSLSMVNLLNLINSTFIGTNVQTIFINVFGQWNGDFLGWGDISAASGGYTLAFSNASPNTNGGCQGCAFSSDITNNATVNNNITSNAISGQNTIDGKKAKITTGNAYSLVSVMNLVNTSFINSNGVFGFINIFGTLNGNIGGKSNFEPQKTVSTPDNSNSEDDQGGGSLLVTQSNNVGDHVLPGDTVSFIISVKNTGVGKIHGAKLDLGLARNGTDVGGGIFKLGDIEPGKTIRVNTGMVLRKSAHQGKYIADAKAEGSTGPNTVSGEAFSSFNVLGLGTVFASSQIRQSTPAKLVLAENKSVKDLASTSNKTILDLKLFLILMLLYFVIKTMKNYSDLRSLFHSKSLAAVIKTAQRMLL